MARVIVGSWAVRYPLGGNLSWTLQWLLGFHQLGHEIYLVEKAGYANSCFDPVKKVMSADCSHGFQVVSELLKRFDLRDRLCYVDSFNRYHGISKRRIEGLFQTADLFIDLGTHGAWLEEAEQTGVCILVDGEPGSTQMKMVLKQRNGHSIPRYDHYFSNGANMGTDKSTAPTADLSWQPLFNPVDTSRFETIPPKPNAPLTTVMNWQAHAALEFDGREYGQKDRMFPRFLELPKRIPLPMEVAAAGKIPRGELARWGWSVVSAHEVTSTFDSYLRYIYQSAGEFSVCKEVYVETRSGWFSDRSAAYLAAGRPVVLQETGFSDHLPCGCGLFAVETLDQAAAAIEAIARDHQGHAKAAREIAVEFLDSRKCAERLLNKLELT